MENKTLFSEEKEKIVTNNSSTDNNEYLGLENDKNQTINSLSTYKIDNTNNSNQNNEQINVSGFRWYICAIFCLFCLLQSGTFNFYSPIDKSIEAAYNWTPRFIEWLLNSANLTFMIFTIPVSFLIDKYGLRYPMIATSSCMFICAFLRLISPSEFSSYKIFSVFSSYCF